MFELTNPFKNFGVPEKAIRKSFLDIDKLAAKYGWAGYWGHFTPRDAREWFEKLSELSDEEQEQEISKYFIQMFSKDNFIGLEELFSKWSNNPIFSKRMSFFQNCLFILRSKTDSFNPSNLVVPILIIQMDGIMAELIETEGWAYDEKLEEWIHPNYPKGKKRLSTSDKVVGFLIKDKRTCDAKSFIDTKPDVEKPYFISRLVQTNSRYELLNEGLFQRAHHGVKLKNSLVLSRHKILHGEDLEYGTLENTIKLFLFLDYFSRFKVSNLIGPDDHTLLDLRVME